MVPRLATARSAPAKFSPSDVIESRPSPLSIMSALRKAAKLDYLQHETLQLLLQKCHYLASTDPRDKVYALFNIARDRETLGIIPDYGLSVANVYVGIRKEEHDMGLAFQVSMVRVAATRSLCVTEGGYLVMAPLQAERGDHVCLLSGGKLPYIVRASISKETLMVGKGTPLEFIGDAYVHGLMKEEAMRRTSLKFEDIILI